MVPTNPVIPVIITMTILIKLILSTKEITGIVHGKYVPIPRCVTTLDTITITNVRPIGAKYPFVTLANKALVVLTAIIIIAVSMKVKNSLRIKEIDPPLIPMKTPTPVTTINEKLARITFQIVITINLDNTLYVLGIGFTSRSLMVLSVYSRPKTHAEVKEQPTTSSVAVEASKSDKYDSQSRSGLLKNPSISGNRLNTEITTQKTVERYTLRASQFTKESIFMIAPP